MTDYYSILSRAVASLESNTAQARAELFERARNLLIDRIEREPGRWTNEAALAEVANFDAATDRIEAEAARRRSSESIGRHPRQPRADDRTPPPHDVAPVESKRGIGRVAAFSAVGLLGVLLVGLAIYAFSGRPTTSSQTAATTAPGGGVVAKAPEAKKAVSSRPSLDGDDLEPGVDGGSTDAGLPYYLRRQAVYYRTVYSPGMIVVDRSQRFLYLVQPQSRALRYGIGVGGECDISAGLYRIKSKSQQWPEWSPSPDLLKRRTYPPKVAGGPGNPLGAYALYFESNLPGIHGTNAPKSIGQAPTLGCFRLVNDDVVDLEKRIAIGTGVVVLN
ncbi:MAG: L,D-transpeptidase [Xanthobacteraceae bacterium]|nr:L,D-transpeptidase [Xanthobacteraceae bacterium]